MFHRLFCQSNETCQSITDKRNHFGCNKSNTTGFTCGAGTTYPSEVSELTPVFRSVVFCVMFCRSLFVVFCLALYCLSIYGFWLSILYLQSFRGKRKCLTTHINSQLLQAFATERFLQII
jgi:hypothetical protein